MNADRYSDARALWGVLWRSVVFTPYMLFIFVSVGAVWLARWFLPVYGAVLAYGEDWWAAAGTFSVWLLVVWGYRRFKLRRFFEDPPVSHRV